MVVEHPVAGHDARGSGEPSDQKFFFIHVMKTGGTSVWFQARRQFGAASVYPDPDVDRLGPFGAYMQIESLLSLAPERLARLRCISGHFPFVVTEMLGGSFVTMSVLRHPVDRTVSFLKHWRTLNPGRAGLSLEQLYDNELDRKLFATNHQTRLYSLTVEDEPQSFLDLITVDARRLEQAKANVDRVDVLGLQDEYERFLEQLEHRFGWDFRGMDKQLVSAPEDVPAALSRRILADNQADLELYEHARERVRRL